MSRDEIRKEIERVESVLFSIMMVDRWTKEDYRLNTEYTKRLNELKKMEREMS